MKKQYNCGTYKTKFMLSVMCLIVSFFILFSNFYKFNSSLSYRISGVIFNTVNFFINIPNKYNLYIHNISYSKSLEEQVAKLKKDIVTLQGININYNVTKEENIELKNLLSVLNKNTLFKVKDLLTANVYSKNFGNAYPFFSVNVGTKNGITDNLNVVANNSLIGITQDTTENYSKIILLNNVKSRVPVYTKTSKINAIMVGDNSSNPHLISYDNNQSFQDGDILLTSGLGKLFQRNIAVGTIYNNKGMWYVKLFSDLYNVDYVHIIKKNAPFKKFH